MLDPLAACAAYRCVEAAIAELRRDEGRDLNLESLSQRVGAKPLSLQRTFSAWAGVSPKRFAQVLAAARSRAALAAGADVLQASLSAGLSGPGRLHDLMVNLEACTPGELGARGAGLVLRWGVGATPFGEAFVASTERGIHRLAFVDDAATLDSEVAGLASAWPRATFEEDAQQARTTLARVFEPPSDPPRPLHLWVRGTNAQVAVWRALLRLPPGACLSYSALARHVATPRAVRAVASAVAQNPVAWVIPCHRVLRQDGALAGYAWGLDRKAAMLGREALEQRAR